MKLSRNSQDWLGEMTIATDEHGRFEFSNVPPNEKYYVYGLMDSFKKYGSLPVLEITTREHDSVFKVGKLKVEPGHTLKGRLILANDKPVPPHTRVLLSREQAWDTQMVEVDEQGRFEFTGLPTEEYSIGSSIKGYYLSPKNYSWEYLNGISIDGMIDHDIDDLTILYESGKLQRPNYSDAERDRRWREFLARSAKTIKGVSPDER